MYKFGNRSLKNLETCDPALQAVVNRVMEWQVMDFSVTEGHRSIERQQKLFKQGRSKLDGINKKGKHNYMPSRAVDLAPYPIDYQDLDRFKILAGLMFAAAAEEGVVIRWGGDWDMDWNMAEGDSWDKPHFELMGKR